MVAEGMLQVFLWWGTAAPPWVRNGCFGNSNSINHTSLSFLVYWGKPRGMAPGADFPNFIVTEKKCSCKKNKKITNSPPIPSGRDKNGCLCIRTPGQGFPGRETGAGPGERGTQKAAGQGPCGLALRLPGRGTPPAPPAGPAPAGPAAPFCKRGGPGCAGAGGRVCAWKLPLSESLTGRSAFPAPSGTAPARWSAAW